MVTSIQVANRRRHYWGQLFGVALLSATLARGTEASEKTRLPTLETLGGAWIGIDNTGSVCRLVLEEQDGSGAVACDLHGTMLGQTFRSIQFDRFEMKINLTRKSSLEETHLEGEVLATALDLYFHPSKKHVRFFRADELTSALERTEVTLSRLLDVDTATREGRSFVDRD